MNVYFEHSSQVRVMVGFSRSIEVHDVVTFHVLLEDFLQSL